MEKLRTSWLRHDGNTLLSGQFWNTQVSIESYTGPVNEEYGEVDRNLLHLITVQGITKSRSFLGEYSKTSWDRSGK